MPFANIIAHNGLHGFINQAVAPLPTVSGNYFRYCKLYWAQRVAYVPSSSDLTAVNRKCFSNAPCTRRCGQTARAPHRFDAIRIVERVETRSGPFDWEFISPGRLLPELVRTSPRVRSIIAAAARESKPTESHPWRLIVAFDEFSPGNKLNCNNTRHDAIRGTV